MSIRGSVLPVPTSRGNEPEPRGLNQPSGYYLIYVPFVSYEKICFNTLYETIFNGTWKVNSLQNFLIFPIRTYPGRSSSFRLCLMLNQYLGCAMKYGHKAPPQANAINFTGCFSPPDSTTFEIAISENDFTYIATSFFNWGLLLGDLEFWMMHL